MMPELIAHITTVWLDSAVPSSLHEMDGFQDVIANARSFCAALETLGLSGLGDLKEWVGNAPAVWVSKCRQAALDSVRLKLSQGLGAPKQIERIEKQMVSKAEGKVLTAATGPASAEAQGWDAAWSDDENEPAPEPTSQKSKEEKAHVRQDDDDGTDAWGWGDEEAADRDGEETAGEKPEEPKPEEPKEEAEQGAADDDDPSEAWGWGDDGGEDDAPDTAHPTQPVAAVPAAPAAVDEAATRELTLKETYHISSMPEPVLSLIFAILEDGATLTRDDHANSPVVTAVAGLFSLPTLALALFRAISPYYYSLDMGGNMCVPCDFTLLTVQTVVSNARQVLVQRCCVSERTAR